MKFLAVSSILFCLGLAEKPNVVFVLFDDLGWSDVRFVEKCGITPSETLFHPLNIEYNYKTVYVKYMYNICTVYIQYIISN